MSLFLSGDFKFVFTLNLRGATLSNANQSFQLKQFMIKPREDVKIFSHFSKTASLYSSLGDHLLDKIMYIHAMFANRPQVKSSSKILSLFWVGWVMLNKIYRADKI